MPLEADLLVQESTDTCRDGLGGPRLGGWDKSGPPWAAVVVTGGGAHISLLPQDC